MGVKARQFDYGNKVGILFERDVNGTRYIAKPMEIEWIEAGKDGIEIKPTLIVTHFDAKDLTEELSALGMPTKKESALEGKLGAQTLHLDDMRRIVFKRKP